MRLCMEYIGSLSLFETLRRAGETVVEQEIFEKTLGITPLMGFI